MEWNKHARIHIKPMFFNNYNALILWVDGNRGNLIEVEKIDVPVELKETY